MCRQTPCETNATSKNGKPKVSFEIKLTRGTEIELYSLCRRKYSEKIASVVLLRN